MGNSKKLINATDNLSKRVAEFCAASKNMPQLQKISRCDNADDFSAAVSEFGKQLPALVDVFDKMQAFQVALEKVALLDRQRAGQQLGETAITSMIRSHVVD